MTENELNFEVDKAKNALDNIVAETEKFADENILKNCFFSFGGGWNDVCGKSISNKLVSSVNEAVARWINIYNCKKQLEKIIDDIAPLFQVIEAARRELQ